MYVRTFRAFIRQTKTGSTEAPWNRAYPCRQWAEQTIEYEMVMRVCKDSKCLRQNNVSAPEGQNLS